MPRVADQRWRGRRLDHGEDRWHLVRRRSRTIRRRAVRRHDGDDLRRDRGPRRGGRVSIWRNPQSWYGSWAFTATAVVVAVVTGLAMVSAGSHTHAHGATGHTHGGDRRVPAAPATRTPRPSCRPRSTTRTSPSISAAFAVSHPSSRRGPRTSSRSPCCGCRRWKDPAYAEAHGFHSIGDGFTGDEHFINQAFFDDGRILDPDHPESLVYDTRSGKRGCSSRRCS